VDLPSNTELQEIAERYRLELTDGDLEEFRWLLGASMFSYERVEALADEMPESLRPRYGRDGGRAPMPEENPLGAWFWKTVIRGQEEGKLSGKRVVLEDNVCLAGVPMMNGTALLEGYAPDIDATVVQRILDAGGEIVGKAVCEHLCFSGSSFTADTGPVRNPHNPQRSAGGSSSGCAVLVATGEVDMAVGGDQGGSIRIPSSWCGVVGLKPTYGLVPYTGIFPIEQTLDHAGPIARTVYDAALLLEVIAGPDGLDPRQTGLLPKPYTTLLDGNVQGLRVGVLREGFGWEGKSEPDVDEAVREAAASLRAAGAVVDEVSVPLHRDGVHIWNVIGTEGTLDRMIDGFALGTGWKGYYQTGLAEAYAEGLRARADRLTDTVKLVILGGAWVRAKRTGGLYGKAQNLVRLLAQAYDEALRSYDVLVLPTTPMKATPLPHAEASRAERVMRALEMINNTAPFDLTGHPAISVPCGMSEGLPVGMMLVGRRGEDDVVLRVAYAYEQLRGGVR
jgi:amidase